MATDERKPQPAVRSLQAVVDLVEPGARLVGHRPLTGGVSALLVALSFRRGDGSEGCVVVRRHAADDSPSGLVAREFALMSLLADRGLPIPRGLRFDGSRSRLETPFLVMEFVEGTTSLPHPVRSARAMADLMGRIHAVEDLGAISMPRRLDPSPELRLWLDGQPDAAPVLAAVGQTAPPYTRPPRLLHGDLWPGNLLWRDDEIVAVLDWEDAAIGDPLSDVACTRVELFCLVGRAAMEAFTDRYMQSADADPTRLAAWDLYVSVAALRFMDGWGLPREVLAARRDGTLAFRADAARRLLAP